ncbi:MAG: nicotinate-nucleotide adenylyltransferase [Acidimicrobiaceae bacterium]|nr:nicotinate-nucleotide adenylyltransferase [Acidimicrobiaceae bacterium]
MVDLTLNARPTGHRLGIFGGTFDPPHLGHVAIACDVRHRLQLDVVLFVVANDPWQKSSVKEVTSPSLRLAMVRAALKGFEGLRACTLEIDRGGESSMVDTLTELKGVLPGPELFLIVGSDVASQLDTWRRPAEVELLATMVVVKRSGDDDAADSAAEAVSDIVGMVDDGTKGLLGDMTEGDDTNKGYIFLDDPISSVSSTDIRTRYAEGRSVDELIPATVDGIIREHGLYGCKTSS